MIGFGLTSARAYITLPELATTATPSAARIWTRLTRRRPATAPPREASLTRRERDDRHLFKAATPLPEIDPIEEPARMINEAQDRDVQDEGRFADLVEGNSRAPNAG